MRKKLRERVKIEEKVVGRGEEGEKRGDDIIQILGRSHPVGNTATASNRPASLRLPRLVSRRLLKRRRSLLYATKKKKKGIECGAAAASEGWRRTGKVLERDCGDIDIYEQDPSRLGWVLRDEGALAKERQWLPVVHRKDPWIHYGGSGRRCIRDGSAAVGGVLRQMESDGLIWLPVSSAVRREDYTRWSQ